MAGSHHPSADLIPRETFLAVEHALTCSWCQRKQASEASKREEDCSHKKVSLEVKKATVQGQSNGGVSQIILFTFIAATSHTHHQLSTSTTS
jgi:hypothetical protein